MGDQAFSQEQVDALAAKLNSIDFTAEERSLLHAIFQAAASGGEVQGFGVFNMMVDKVLPLLTQPKTPPTGSTIHTRKAGENPIE